MKRKKKNQRVTAGDAVQVAVEYGNPEAAGMIADIVERSADEQIELMRRELESLRTERAHLLDDLRRLRYTHETVIRRLRWLMGDDQALIADYDLPLDEIIYEVKAELLS